MLMVVAGVAVAAFMLWPSKGNTTDKAAAVPSASATAPSKDQQYFNGISQVIKAGNLHQQALYVADEFRSKFVQQGVLMFPKGTKVVFNVNTLVTDSPTTGSIKATAGGTDYLVLLLKEKDASGHAVWHISDTEKKVNN